MTTTPTVVVGCDGTPASDAALRFAADEVHLRQGRLLVVAAYRRPIDPDLDDFDIPDSRLRTRVLGRAEVALDRALGSRVVTDLADRQLIAAEGDPAQVLIEHATGAVMIVIGSHERPVLQRLFGRATSRHLLHDSHIPVTVVPSGSRVE